MMTFFRALPFGLVHHNISTISPLERLLLLMRYRFQLPFLLVTDDVFYIMSMSFINVREDL